jgi:hypothetical protein
MAQQTCKQLQADIANSNADKKGFDWNNLTPGGIINSLGDAFGSRNNSKTFNTNINNTSISTTDITNIFNSCTNSSESIQRNDLSQTPECYETIGKLCNGNLPCLLEMSKVTDVEQQNTQTIKLNCIINNLLKTISSKEVSMENAAQLSTLQKASGLMSSNKSLTSNCNQVNNDISSSSFLNAITTCANEYSSQQINSINACGNLSNVRQKSTNDFFSNCYASQGIFKEDTVKVKSFNKALISTDQKADTSMSSISSSIMIIIFALVGVFAFMMFKKKKAQQMQPG